MGRDAEDGSGELQFGGGDQECDGGRDGHRLTTGFGRSIGVQPLWQAIRASGDIPAHASFYLVAN